MVKSAQEVKQRKDRKERTGTVLSDRMQKTIVVECKTRFRHPTYLKVMTKFKKLYAHDEKQQAKTGDIVRVIETRPYSKLKRWSLVEVVQKADQAKIAVKDVV